MPSIIAKVINEIVFIFLIWVMAFGESLYVACIVLFVGMLAVQTHIHEVLWWSTQCVLIEHQSCSEKCVILSFLYCTPLVNYVARILLENDSSTVH